MQAILNTKIPDKIKGRYRTAMPMMTARARTRRTAAAPTAKEAGESTKPKKEVPEGEESE
jgi:hypothetical protein